MDRRELLKTATAASLVGSLFGPEALASSELLLEERLLHLEEHTGLLAARAPAPLLTRGLRAAGLPLSTFSDILSGLLFARVFKECTEQEQQDARWLPVMERIVPRFTESLGALMERMETRADSRAVRRMLRRPNKLARIVNSGLTGKTTARERELRQAMGALAAEPDPLGDLYQGFDAAAQAAGTTRQALAVPSAQSTGGSANAVGADNERLAPQDKKKLLAGLLLLLGAPLVFGLGLVVGYLGFMGFGVVIGAMGIGLCVLAVVMAVIGIVYIVKALLGAKQRADELEQMSDADVLLAADVEYLLAA